MDGRQVAGCGIKTDRWLACLADAVYDTQPPLDHCYRLQPKCRQQPILVAHFVLLVRRPMILQDYLQVR